MSRTRNKLGLKGFQVRDTPPTNTTPFGKWLYQTMKDKGYEKQSQLEQATGVSQETISRIINGTTKPSADTRDKLEAVLGAFTREVI